jgi:hypothetical protein
MLTKYQKFNQLLILRGRAIPAENKTPGRTREDALIWCRHTAHKSQEYQWNTTNSHGNAPE